MSEVVFDKSLNQTLIV